MDTTVYVSTYSLKKQIDKSFKTIIKYRNTDLKIINDNLYIIRNAYFSVKGAMKNIKKLPANEYGKIRIFSIAEIFCHLNKNNINIEKLIEYLENISSSVNLDSDEISLLPEIFKSVLIINITNELDDSPDKDSLNKISASIESLRLLNAYVFEDLYEKISKSEIILDKDITYRNSDKKSRDRYRHKVSQLAKKFKQEETDVINDLLYKTKRISHGKKSTLGYYLFKKKNIKILYFPILIIATILIQTLIYLSIRDILSLLFTLLPSYIISKQLTDILFSACKAEYVTRLKLESVPKTLVTIITFINTEKAIDSLCDKCVQYMYSNNTKGLYFGFLADLPESTSPLTPIDRSLVEYAENKIKELNNKYGDKFFCAVREKSLNTEDGLYKGRERKRGAVSDFLREIENGTQKNFIKLYGDVYDAKYFISLDSDTLPGINSLKELISVLENPINEPEINSEGTAIYNGCAIAVPRIETELQSSIKNHFTKIFSGKSGSETYSYPSFNVYQDIFEDAVFAGKGAINIRLFNKILNGTLDTGAVLSHDIIEGLFLRTVYVSDVVFYDKSPSNIFSYLGRLDRWIRGDWQNIRYLLPKIKIADGSKIKNPFRASAKFKIADNILRSLSNTSIYFLLLFAIIANKTTLILLVFFILFKDILITLPKILLNPISLLPIYLRSGVFSSISKSFLYSFSVLILLPSFSFCEIKAIVKAIYRQITKKKLLEWTTAEQADKNASEKQKVLKKMLVQFIGIPLCFFSLGFPLAIFWILGLPYVTILSSTKHTKIFDNESDKVMRDMWKYFDDFLIEKFNYLPPDNYQENPLIGCATRTSPTNIGLTLLTILGAYDMSFINEEKCLNMIENTLISVESLEHYKGHLLNWYDITTKKPLYPKYVSTVDNGNYICCIYTLRNAMVNFSLPKASDVINKLDKIIENTDLSFLYNKDRKLFHIGYDVENQKPSESFYDLYASESRLTSYYAIASGQIDPEHWNKLGRPLVIKNGTVGIKSWSGTVFEYLMPHLLLPVKEGSLSEEMIRFSIEAQIKSVHKKTAVVKDDPVDIPWGISESCYYSLGSDLAFQYKAFGEDITAINKHNLPYNEIIVSPYSTFLTMPYSYRNSVKNLNLLSLYNSKGKYGYYEAIDFRKSTDKYTPQTISTFMVHHIGMSFLALLNIKKDNIMQKRFMDKKMSAFSLLLDEAIPTVNFNPSEAYDVKQKNFEYENKPAVIYDHEDETPQFKSYSDGESTLIVSSDGNNILKYKDKDITYNHKNNYNGICAFLKTGKNIIPFCFAPLKENSFNYKTVFEEGYAEHEVKSKNITLKQSSTIIQGKSCELNEFSVKNNSVFDLNGELLVYLEPILQETENYQMHPIFSKLFIEADYSKDDNTLYIIRRNRQNGQPEMMLCIYFDRNIKYDFELSRFNLIETNRGTASIIKAFNSEFSNRTEGPVDPCIAIKIKITAKAKEEFKLKMYLGFENSKEKLLKNRLQILDKKHSLKKIADDTTYYSIKNKRLSNLDNKDLKVSELLLNAIYSKNKVNSTSMIPKNTLGIENLWKHGISGNNPIITIKISEDNYNDCEPFIKAFAYLKSQNISCELVLCLVEELGYDRKIRTKLIEKIMSVGLTNLTDKPNGIFIINLSDVELYSLLNSVSVLAIDLSYGLKLKKHSKIQKKEPIYDVKPVKVNYKLKTGIGGFTEKGFAIDDKDRFTHKPPWSNVLANETFGMVLSDSSLGFTYAFNSYQNKITPWENDVTKDNSGEALYIITNKDKEKRLYDIIRNSTVIFNKKYAEYISTTDNVFIKVRVFVPQTLRVKVIRVKIENPNNESIKLKFIPQIIMNDRKYGKTVSKTRVDDTIFFTNPFNSEFKEGTVFLKGINMKPEGEGLFGIIQEERTSEFVILLGYERTMSEAENTSAILTKERIENEERTLLNNTENDIEIQTPSDELNLFYNSFLKNQIINCRLYARAGFHQCSGAFGFRDQLQDALCIAALDSDFLKKQILLCAQNQFEEGDVLHWFHVNNLNSKTHKGVRSKSSDDLLWFPYAICEYTEKTQDYNILSVKTNYIKSKLLEETENEKYIEAVASGINETIYDHGKRALIKASTKGRNGLLVFGSGDWNDGFNGIHNGETVWGTFFIIMVLERFAKLCRKIGDTEFEQYCAKTAIEYRKNIETFAWDNDRYIRGYFDDGSKLGCESSTECKIDLIVQSFAAICGNFDNEKINTAIKTAEELLVDKEHGIIKLFTPPFNKSENYPGYIKGYIPGIRENGGQYTHSSLWYVLALLKTGHYNKAFELIEMINPINHSKTLKDIEIYRNEPYVLSADIYTNPAHYGMGGWSWYTGSAGWFFKIVTEEILGIKQFGEYLTIDPKIPDSWNSYSINIKKDGKTVSIKIIRSADNSDSGKLLVDDKITSAIHLDGSNHNAVYYL